MNLLILVFSLCLLGWEYSQAITKSEFVQKIVEEEGHNVDKAQEAAYLADLIMVSSTGDLFNPCPGHSTGLAGESFAELINTLIISECILAAPCSYPHDVGGECRSTTIFDFIVVGGGTTGAVVAARLSEQRDWNILLLEAGGDPPMTSDVPYFFPNLQGTDIDWKFQSVREGGLYNGLMGKVNRWPRGKVLGGTSTIGSMLYIRGHRRDFDNIAGAGNPGWAYDDVLPYFKKSEDIRDLFILGSQIFMPYHSRGGPLPISRFGKKSPLIDIIRNATFEMHQPNNFDINGLTMTGFVSPTSGTVLNGERMNTAKAFLNPVKRRPNLFVIKHAYVTKVHICPKTKRAYGVEYYYKNERTSRTLRASREVIVCAGAIGSPKLLMLSGVGPKNDLDELGVFVQQNLRVGRNLQDQPCFPALPISINFVNCSVTPLDLLDFSYEYLTRRTGPWSAMGVGELVGMINVIPDERPDIKILFTYITSNDTDSLREYVKNYAFDEEIAIQFYDVHYQNDLLIPRISLLRPKSKGILRLKSSNPDDMPLIEGRYFDDPEDLQSMMVGIRFIEELANHPVMKQYNSTLNYINYPGCCNLEPGSDYYWACALSHVAGTGYNPSGTCRMGPCEDPDAVVDAQLHVHGIKGLRVADVSVLPNAITAPLMATAIMIGEKASDLIKLQWLSSYKPWFTTKSPWSRPTTLMTPERIDTNLPYQFRPGALGSQITTRQTNYLT